MTNSEHHHDSRNLVDCIYIAASKLDSRFTRICVASVRHYHPDVTIKILAGGPLQSGLMDELRRYWNVHLANFPSGDYGWGFVKLEPLFSPPGERFLVLDSDTVITGPVLDFATRHSEDFVVDNEVQTHDGASSIYYDHLKIPVTGNPVSAPTFLFNTGQWFGRSGVISREDFRGLVEWGFPPRLVNPDIFKNGEQGILNFVVNERHQIGKISVARVPLMRWPGHGMHGLDADAVSRRSCPSLVVHWAGMKKARLQNMIGSDLLEYFERIYYQQLPAGAVRRVLAGCKYALSHWLRWIRLRTTFGAIKQTIKRICRIDQA